MILKQQKVSLNLKLLKTHATCQQLVVNKKVVKLKRNKSAKKRLLSVSKLNNDKLKTKSTTNSNCKEKKNK